MKNAALVLTIIGPDRPGLVEGVSTAVAGAGGSWLQSRMARLGGHFAGILLAEVPEPRVEELGAALHALEDQELRIVVERSGAGGAGPPGRLLELALVGQDRPGIVRDISGALAALRINVEDLSTEVVDASWSGGTLFRATAQVRVPEDLEVDAIREALEDLANELMVDIELEPVPVY